MKDCTTIKRTLDGGRITLEDGKTIVEFPELPEDKDLGEFRKFTTLCNFPAWTDFPHNFTPEPAVCHLLRLSYRDSCVPRIRLFIQYVGPVVLYYARKIMDGKVSDFLSTPLVRLESGRGRTKAKDGDATFFYAFVYKGLNSTTDEHRLNEITSIRSMFSDITRRHYLIQIDIEPTATDYTFSSSILIPSLLYLK